MISNGFYFHVTDRFADHKSGWMMPHFLTNIGYWTDNTAMLQQLHSREAFKGRVKVQSDPSEVRLQK